MRSRTTSKPDGQRDSAIRFEQSEKGDAASLSISQGWMGIQDECLGYRGHSTSFSELTNFSVTLYLGASHWGSLH